MVGLDQLLTKNLVQDIEESGLTRKEFQLLPLCEAKPHLYGEPGSDKRRAVQKKFDLLLRKDPTQYQTFLDKVAVNSGEGKPLSALVTYFCNNASVSYFSKQCPTFSFIFRIEEGTLCFDQRWHQDPE
jgi:hypothetical protein